MKKTIQRILLGLLAVALLFVVTVAGALAVALSGNAASVDGQELGPLVRTVKDGFSNLFVIDVGDGTVALVDAGKDRAGKALLAELSRRHLDPAAVAAVFLTHGHSDHIGALAVLPNATVFAMEAEVPLIEGSANSRGMVARLMGKNAPGAHVTHTLKDGETVAVGKHLVQAFAVPGHTRGSAAYLAGGVLFFGDSAGSAKDGRIHRAPWAFSDDVAQNETSIKALAQRLSPRAGDIKALAFGHTAGIMGFQALADFAAAH